MQFWTALLPIFVVHCLENTTLQKTDSLPKVPTSIITVPKLEISDENFTNKFPIKNSAVIDHSVNILRRIISIIFVMDLGGKLGEMMDAFIEFALNFTNHCEIIRRNEKGLVKGKVVSSARSEIIAAISATSASTADLNFLSRFFSSTRFMSISSSGISSKTSTIAAKSEMVPGHLSTGNEFAIKSKNKGGGELSLYRQSLDLNEDSTTFDKTTISSTNQSYNKDYIGTCFGKIRSTTGFDSNFRTLMDRYSQTAQVDQIDQLIRQKMVDLCTEKEISETESFLDDQRGSIQIAQLVSLNLTNDEKDRLNVYENINDVTSMRNFFLAKFHALTGEQYKRIQKTYNDILMKFVYGSLKQNIGKFLSKLNSQERNILKAYGITSQPEKINEFIDQKFTKMNLSSDDEDEIRKYVRGLFMSINYI
ncbi:unnamed protein product [Dracunculus medinensis]|uniref:Annexin n=1 Tax=Dracunculus medinensis TaxID=318479 RepID=A0A0N4U7T0_DRAME|nr:unnamed protein product [Dracunculus medinensis]